MRQIYNRLAMLQDAVIAARVLAKVSSTSLYDLPRNLPAVIRNEYNDSLQRTLDKTRREGLPWRQVDEGKWVASPSIEEVHEEGCAGDIFYLTQTFSNAQQSKHHIENLAYEQCVIILFAQLDAFLNDLIVEICRKERRVLASGKNITWQEVVDLAGYEEIISVMVNKYVFEFGMKSLSERIELLENKFGLQLSIQADTLKNLLIAEQARHLFTHTGGIVSSAFLEKTKSSDYSIGDRVAVDYSYCQHLASAVLYLAQHTADAACKKFWGDESAKRVDEPYDDSTRESNTLP